MSLLVTNDSRISAASMTMGDLVITEFSQWTNPADSLSTMYFTGVCVQDFTPDDFLESAA
jgi:hypothetical protein